MQLTMTEVSMPRSDNRRVVVELFEDLVATFGKDEGEAIIEMIIRKCGGLRMRIPDFEDLYRLGRDRAIRNQHTKGDVSVTALMVEWNMSRPQILRILNDGDGKGNT
jgi:hypothetical protein